MAKEPDDALKEALARQIGALFLNFSGFEHTLNLALAAALELNEFQERSLLRGMMSRAKLDLLEAFAKKHWTPEAYRDTKEVAAKARMLSEFRNSIAHGTIVHDNDGVFHLITFRGADRFGGKAEPISPETIGPHIDGAIFLSGVFRELADKVTAEMRQRLTSPPPQHPTTG